LVIEQSFQFIRRSIDGLRLLSEFIAAFNVVVRVNLDFHIFFALLKAARRRCPSPNPGSAERFYRHENDP